MNGRLGRENIRPLMQQIGRHGYGYVLRQVQCIERQRRGRLVGCAAEEHGLRLANGERKRSAQRTKAGYSR